MYFELKEPFVESKKAWIERHISNYSFEYLDWSELFDTAGFKFKKVTGVKINDKQEAKNYKSTWSKCYKHQLVLTQTQIDQTYQILEWCEENLDGYWSFVEHIYVYYDQELKYNPVGPISECLFTTSKKENLLAFKLNWHSDG